MTTVSYKVNPKLSLFYKCKNLITTCHFLKEESTLDIGMKPFWWKYFDGKNPKSKYAIWAQSDKKCYVRLLAHVFISQKPKKLKEEENLPFCPPCVSNYYL